MRSDDFNGLMEHTFNNLRRLRALKGGEYASDADVLQNFKDAAHRLDLNPETVWSVYADKHWSAILRHCKDLEMGVERPVLESIEERVYDLMVYCLLFLAIKEETWRKADEEASND